MLSCLRTSLLLLLVLQVRGSDYDIIILTALHMQSISNPVFLTSLYPSLSFSPTFFMFSSSLYQRTVDSQLIFCGFLHSATPRGEEQVMDGGG